MAKQIILASTSPRRKALLKQIGLEFIIVPSDIEEKLNPRYKPRRQAEILSLQKAESVALKQKHALIISADTLVALNDEIFGKPKDRKDAKRMLGVLSGTTHSIFTGFTIIDTDTKKTVTKSIETKVTFKKLTAKEIQSYLATPEPYDKAGAYAIHLMAAVFVEKIEGDFFGAVGLPLHLLAEELKRFGVKIL
jgi:septum formation protein